MTFVPNERRVRIDSYIHNGNLLRPEKSYRTIRLWLPEVAPAACLYQEWAEGDVPSIDDEPPSAVVELISAELEKAWIDTSREHKRTIIAWCRENAEMLDRLWAEELIREAERRIARAQREIVIIRQTYLDFDEEFPVVLACDHGLTFEADAAVRLKRDEVRKRWPRLNGECPKGCGFHGIAYASVSHHFLGGDWE